MPADYISRVIERVDNDAPDLDDDSALVFAADVDVGQDNVGVETPTYRRPGDDDSNRRQTTIITLPAGDYSHDSPTRQNTAESTAQRTGYAFATSSHECCLRHRENCASPKSVNLTDCGKTDADFTHMTAGTADCAASTTSCADTAASAAPTADSSIRIQNDVLSQLTELRPNADLARMQRQSPDLAEMINCLEQNILPADNDAARRIVLDADNWTIDDNGIVYHVYNPRKRNVNSVKPVVQQLAVPQPLRQKVLVAMHDNNSHFRLDKTYQTILNHFYWKGLYSDLRKHLQNCIPCSLSSQKPPPPTTLQHAPLLSVFEKLTIDHVSMPTSRSTLTGQQVSYVLTLVDQASQWIVLVPLVDCTAKTTALAIQQHWICHFGAPKQIHSDLGPAFTSQLLKELCTLYNIQHTFASSQNHKSVSRPETIHRVILSALRKICVRRTDGQTNTEVLDWPDRLPGVLLSLHSSVVTTIGLSPAYMVFHRELRLPWLTELPFNLQHHDKTLTHLLDTVRMTDNLIRDNTLESFDKADKQYNKKASLRSFKIGQKALLYSEYVPAGIMRKLHIFYRPIEIVECMPNKCYKVRDLNTNRLLPAKIYVDRLKPLVNAPTGTDTPTVPDSPESKFQASTGQQPTSHDATQRATRRSHTQSRQAQKQQPAPMPQSQQPASHWERIIGIRQRRHRSDGSYVYLVNWASDNSASWLPAKDISPDVVRRFNASKRRRRT